MTASTSAARRKAERYALRVEVGGRMVAAHLPPEMHGKPGTYGNHGCRCGDCTMGWTRAARETNRRRRIREELEGARRKRG